MYLEKTIFINRAPFEHLELDFKKNGINVLTAINGKGKTTILSHIVDAFHEMARPNFTGSYEGKENKFYRFSSSMFNLNMSVYSMVYFRFKDIDDYIDYVDYRGDALTDSEYDRIIPFENKIPLSLINQEVERNNCAKINSGNFNKQKALDIFSKNLFTYFPAYRYEQPAYLNDPYKLSFNFTTESGFNGYLPNPIEVITGLKTLSSWIMDVVLDWEVYKRIESIQKSDGKFVDVDLTPESVVFRNLNDILTAALSSKLYKGRIRLGISKRNIGGQRISIMQDIDNNSKQISPNIFCLSSGELSFLCLFGEILRQGDTLKANISLHEIQGIVLIDEIDKHLHIKLQKEVLPKLLNLFPNIQFIVSSHSPFFNMGLADIVVDRTQIIDLDNSGITCTPYNNELYKEVYEMMISENNRFAEKYNSLKERIKSIKKPVVITEGKTDMKHILKAKEKLGISDIDFECIESECQPDGDSNLKTMLEQLCKLPRENKIIGIFDRDIDLTVNDIEKEEQPYKDYGNGIYAFCISAPLNRIERGQTKISIEYLYSDDEIKTTLENGCRLFFGNEFKKKSLRHNTEQLTLGVPKGKGNDKIIENNGGQAVYDNTDNNVLAKKNDFADAIYSNKIVISNESWNNFNHIFEKIRTIVNL